MAAHDAASRAHALVLSGPHRPAGEVATSIAVNLNLRFIRPPDEGSVKETSTGSAWCKHLWESGADFFRNPSIRAGFPGVIRRYLTLRMRLRWHEVCGRVTPEHLRRHHEEPHPEDSGAQQHAQTGRSQTCTNPWQ